MRIIWALITVISILFSVGCKEDHNKGYWLTVRGIAVDKNGVPVPNAEIEYPFGSQCCSPLSPNVVAGICKFVTDADGKWSSRSQVCSDDQCACNLTAKKSGFTDVNMSFNYNGTSDSSPEVRVIFQ